MEGRPRPSARDYAWLVFMLVVLAGLAASFARMLYLIATKQQLRALAPLPVGVACAVILVMSAWRRTVWSASATDSSEATAEIEEPEGSRQ